MEFIKNNLNVCRNIQNGCADIGVDDDIIVPDIMPDILKIIQVDGNAFITSCESEQGKLSCEGKLQMKILYIPDNREEKIKSIVTSSDFSYVMNNSGITDESVIDISADVARVDFQLINSRKLKIKSIVSLCYDISETEQLELVADAEGEDMPEMYKKTISANSFVAFKDTRLLVRESLELPSGQEPIGELLKLDASMGEYEYKVITGRVVIKGSCNVCALYTDTSGNVRYADFEMPFTEIVDMENASEETICKADLSIGEISYHAENDSDGDTRIIYTEVTVCASFNAYENIMYEYIDDCYCPGKNMTVEKESKEIENVLASSYASFSMREVVPPSSGTPKLGGIYNFIAKPVIDTASADDGKICVEGKIICYCLYLCGGEEIPVHSIKKELKFCETVDLPEAHKGAVCRVNPLITHKSASLNSSGETEIKISYSLDMLVTDTVTVPLISSYEISELEASEYKGIVIYFVQNGDSLWNIAKKYKVCASDIAELNELENNEIRKGMQLLIPSV